MARMYGVTIPIAGYVYKEVVADSEEHALDIVLDGEFTNADIEQWETYKHLVRGNVVYASPSSYEVQDLGEADGESTD